MSLLLTYMMTNFSIFIPLLRYGFPNNKKINVGHKLCIMGTPKENGCVRVGCLCHTVFQNMYTPYKAFLFVLPFHVCARPCQSCREILFCEENLFYKMKERNTN